jgi:hypothetical protein
MRLTQMIEFQYQELHQIFKLLNVDNLLPNPCQVAERIPVVVGRWLDQHRTMTLYDPMLHMLKQAILSTVGAPLLRAST